MVTPGLPPACLWYSTGVALDVGLGLQEQRGRTHSATAVIFPEPPSSCHSRTRQLPHVAGTPGFSGSGGGTGSGGGQGGGVSPQRLCHSGGGPPCSTSHVHKPETLY